jgi:hypothetical protein
MITLASSLRLAAAAAALVLSGCAVPAGSMGGMSMPSFGGSMATGTSPTASSGAAGGAASVGGNAALERCSAPLGTLAVDDGRGKNWYASFGAATKITTIEPLIRLAVQQSNCFIITSIGNGRTEALLTNVTDKQRNSGEFRAGSNQQKGQRVAADYFLEPAIIVDNDSTGKMGASLGGLLGRANPMLGALAGNLESKASVVTLTLLDIRSGVQIGIAEGNATATNYGASMAAFGGGAAGGLSGFSRTPEGKATVAAFVDAYNNMVISLRNYKAQDVKGGLGRGGVLKVN